LILYLDASALVKLYTDEIHANAVRAAASKATLIACHDIGYVECRAAFARKRREGGFTSGDHLRARRQLDSDWDVFYVIAADPELLHRAAVLADDHPLRTYDSVHLAAAEAVSGLTRGAQFRFAVFDVRLRRAATALGLAVLES
jgi:predicted nucleic acid-binding protein